MEEGVFRVFRKKPPASKLGTSVFWFFSITVILFLLSWVHGWVGDASGSLAVLTLLATIFGSLPLLVRWIRWRMMWKLRNRLLITYLLIGLAPVVLFGTLTGIAAYVFSGQFANFAATAEINSELTELAARNQDIGFQLAHQMEDHVGSPGKLQLKGTSFSIGDLPPGATSPRIGAFLDGKQMELAWLPETMQAKEIQMPAWANAPFRGVVLDKDQLFFRAIDSVGVGTHTVVTVTSLPLNREFLDRAASGLGSITLSPSTRVNSTISNQLSSPQSSEDGHEPADSEPEVILGQQNGLPEGNKGQPFTTITGGKLSKRTSVFDIPINIPTLLETTNWQTGVKYSVFGSVTSRPSLLYQRLFRQSVLMGTALRIVLIMATVVFGVLQLLALLMASRLSRTITKSVSELYQATQAIDAGNLNYRIQITRNDQLAELSRSFNRMSASLERLLVEQKEKERMQSELAIAQEVQENLFPNVNVALPQLELHGTCRPARAVSGDYYDFLLFGETSVGLAIGDISGKGISAALLMATLHSAVRAYRYCSEDMMASQKLLSKDTANGGGLVEGQELADIFQSPGKILSLLNRHLYQSTQPEKYATLFLAHYDARDRMLRYSNGGQLPPLVLRSDGTVDRLDRGGTVVGLLEGAVYEEGKLQLEPGDIFIGYSDGVTEPENEFGDYGEDRMLEVIRQNRRLPLPEICSRLMHALDDWIGAAEQPDDITLVLARQR